MKNTQIPPKTMRLAPIPAPNNHRYFRNGLNSRIGSLKNFNPMPDKAMKTMELTTSK
jgi:hypothetical protein